MTAAAVLRLAWEGRKFAILLVVGGVAAIFYAQWRGASADRDSLLRWADQGCEAVARPFRDEASPKRTWGTACLVEIRRLAQVERDLKQGSLNALLADLERREGREAADAALAAALSKRAAEAVARMEAADAAVEDDRVGGSWACAVNDLGGLRAPGC